MTIFMRFSITALAILGSLSAVAAEEVWTGVWKLNPGKSPKALNRPQSQIITLKSENGMVSFTEENITAKGDSYQVLWKLVLDGKDYPVTGSRAGIELISGTAHGPDTVELKAKKKDGTTLGTYWVTCSADGKMMIVLLWAGPEVTGLPTRMAIHDRQ